MAEQLGLEQVARDRRSIDGDERFAGPRAMAMQGARDQFFAGTRLTGDEYRGVRLRQSADGAEDLLHGRGLPEHLGHRLVRLGDLAIATTLFECLADELDRGIDVKRFRQVFEGATLKRRDRALQVGVRGHDDDGDLRQACLDLLQQVDARLAWHADVTHHHPRGVFVERLQRLVGGLEQSASNAFPLQGLLEDPAYRAVVVDDPDCLVGHGLTLGSRGWMSKGQQHRKTGVTRRTVAVD